jgi:hypothetical protein
MKIIGIGLNKTGTKTLKAYLLRMGFKHHSYDLDLFNHYRKNNFSHIFDVMEDMESFEDWPWPLMYKEIDRKFPDAKFILTIRKSPKIWYRSLCKMAVRMGPLSKFEKYIYGFSMPHGKKKEHIDFYKKHNEEVREYFKDRPEKLLELRFGEGNEAKKLANFLNVPEVSLENDHRNKSPKVYDGENLFLAHINRIKYQTIWYAKRYFKKWM